MPEQAKIPKYLGKCEILHVHDDGDLTIKCRDKKYVVTTEGEVFRELDREPVCGLITGDLILDLVNAVGIVEGEGKFTKREATDITQQIKLIADQCYVAVPVEGET